MTSIPNEKLTNRSANRPIKLAKSTGKTFILVGITPMIGGNLPYIHGDLRALFGEILKIYLGSY